MLRIILLCLISIFPFFPCFCPEEIKLQESTLSSETGHLSLWVGAIGIALVFLFVLLQYFLSRWACPVREGDNKKIFILNRTNVGHKMCAYLIEVEEELFLIIQSPNQIICEPVRGKACWETFLSSPLKEEEKNFPTQDSIL